jgi:hypothetical protein
MRTKRVAKKRRVMHKSKTRTAEVCVVVDGDKTVRVPAGNFYDVMERVNRGEADGAYVAIQTDGSGVMVPHLTDHPVTCKDCDSTAHTLLKAASTGGKQGNGRVG